MDTINIIHLRLSAVNEELALFNCENKISGVIHTSSVGKTTIVLDGGYVLGVFQSPHSAVDKLTNIHIQLHEAERESGSYAEYKRNMLSTTLH